MSIKFKFLEPYVNDEYYSKMLGLLLTRNSGSEIFQIDDTFKYLNRFSDELENDISIYSTSKLNNYRQFKKFIKSLIKIKLDISMPDVDIDNYRTYFPDIKDNYFVSQLIDNAKEHYIAKTTHDYSSLLTSITDSVSIYNQLKLIDKNIIELDKYLNNDDDTDKSLIGQIQDFKKIIDDTYHKFTELSFNNVEGEEELFWYFDDESCAKISEDTVEYLKDSFVVFETGYPVIDNHIRGIVSSKVYIIAAPSNHGKSLMMSNIVRNMIHLNKHSFSDDGKDVILYYTLEDDKYNNQKRAISIYGNIHPTFVTDVYYFFREKKNKQHAKKFKDFVNDILKSSIIKYTDGKVNLVVVQAEEGTTSTKDIIQHIEKLKFKGYNVKACIIDYIEAMSPSIKDSKGDDYVNQGQIVREMRRLSRIYKIPVVTASQLQRYADNSATELSNSLMGDSIRKIQYSDFVIMLRQNKNRDPSSEDVLRYLTNSSSNMEMGIDSAIELNNKGFVVIEIAVTKAKDGKLSGTECVLKSDSNLRIESDYLTAIRNAKNSKIKTKDYKQKLKNMSMNELSFEIGNDPDVDIDII